MPSDKKKMGTLPKVLIWVGASFGVLLVGIGILLWVVISQETKEQEEAAAKARKAAQEKKVAEDAAFAAMTPEGHLDQARKAFETKNVGLAKKHLSVVPVATKGAAEIKQKIASFEAKEKAARVARAKEAAENLHKNLVAARREFAKKLETNYLDKGLNIDVVTEGKDADSLKIKWALTSKVAAHEISKGDLIDTARALGFKKVRLTNGFESSLAEGYTWNLAK